MVVLAEEKLRAGHLKYDCTYEIRLRIKEIYLYAHIEPGQHSSFTITMLRVLSRWLIDILQNCHTSCSLAN